METVKRIIANLSEDERIAVRLADENDKIKFIITKEQRIRGAIVYKLYKVDEEILTFTGNEADSPIDLEDIVFV